MNKTVKYIVVALGLFLFTGCYQMSKRSVGGADGRTESADSVSAGTGKHYSKNYNFIVKADSIVLLRVQPEEKVSDFADIDTFPIYKNERLVVADFRVIPDDATDSVWVEVADTRAMFGWVHEGRLLEDTVPDDPISQFIDVFSSTHLYLFLTFLVVMAVIYIIVILRRKDAPFVHARDIASFYPTLLCLVTALAATLYTTIQRFAPDAWQEFYFNPTLNPFSTPVIMSLFLISVWAVIIIAIAAVDSVFRELPAGSAFLYTGSVGAVCVVNYIVFSLTTKWTAGYVLFLLYAAAALYRYFRYSFRPYECGKCGARLRRRGKCPFCGTVNE